MATAIGLLAFFLFVFAGGFAVGYSERRKDEVRENARRFERLRDKGLVP